MKLSKRILSSIVALIILILSAFAANADTVYTFDGYSYSLVDTYRASLVGWDNSSDSLIVPHKIGDVYVSEIGDSAFKDDNFIKSVDFSDAKRMFKIGKYAFSKSVLKGNLVIPTRVTNIGTAAFEGCSSLESVQYSSDGGAVSAQCFKDCTSLKNVILTDYITSIERYAFTNCTALETVTIPKSVNTINSTAFNGCPKFTINGYRDSYAQQYAQDNGYDFYILDPLLGDSNGDGNVDIMDATYIQKYKIGAQGYDLTEYQRRCADVNRDGNVTVRDATLIQMKLAKYDVDF